MKIERVRLVDGTKEKREALAGVFLNHYFKFPSSRECI